MASNRRRHSYVRFFMDDWAGGTMRMSRLIRSVYFDVCLYNWDKVAPMPDAEAMLTFSDLGPQGDDIIAALVAAGKLEHDERGYFSPRALDEAEYAFDQWQKRSKGGSTSRGGGKPAAVKEESSKTDGGEQQESGDKEGAPPKPAKPKRTFNSQSVADAWNIMAKANGLSPIKQLTDERRKRLNARIEEHGEPVLIDAINTIPSSPFLMGGGDRGWKIGFDNFVRPELCAKLIEGGFHNEGAGRPSNWQDA